MKSLKLALLAVILVPGYGLAQVRDYPLAREELRDCMARDASLASRQDRLDQEKAGNDAESDSLARESYRLAQDLARLDSTDRAAVAEHNRRSIEHNQRVDQHNRNVAAMNADTARLNRDQSDMSATCGARTYFPQDRDAILRERGYLR